MLFVTRKKNKLLYCFDIFRRPVGCCLAFHANRAKKQIPDIYNVIQLSHLSSFDEPSCSGILMATSLRAPAFERGQTYRRSLYYRRYFRSRAD